MNTERLFKAALAARTNRNSHCHGMEHWARVGVNAVKLALETPGADGLVVCVFALLHDLMRRNDYSDPEHGPRAADLALELARTGALELNTWQLATLVRALRDHDRGQTTEDPTIGCCWDADRLDLPRVGMVPHPRFFSTEYGRAEAARVGRKMQRAREPRLFDTQRREWRKP